MAIAISIVIPILAFILVIGGGIYLNNRILRQMDYRCPKCGAVFSLDYAAYEHVTMHKFGCLYLKCHSCGQMCWASPVPKNKP